MLCVSSSTPPSLHCYTRLVFIFTSALSSSLCTKSTTSNLSCEICSPIWSMGNRMISRIATGHNLQNLSQQLEIKVECCWAIHHKHSLMTNHKLDLKLFGAGQSNNCLQATPREGARSRMSETGWMASLKWVLLDWPSG